MRDALSGGGKGSRRSHRDSFASEQSNDKLIRSQNQGDAITVPISVPGEEKKEDQWDNAYTAKLSGMGQTRGMSVFSADAKSAVEITQMNKPNNKSANEKGKLITNTDQNRKNSVDFFNDRDYYKIFLETSKEQEERIKKNSPFAGLKTWKLLRVIVKTNDDLRQEAFAMQLISQCD